MYVCAVPGDEGDGSPITVKAEEKLMEVIGEVEYLMS